MFLNLGDSFGDAFVLVFIRSSLDLCFLIPALGDDLGVLLGVDFLDDDLGDLRVLLLGVDFFDSFPSSGGGGGGGGGAVSSGFGAFGFEFLPP